MTNRLHRGLTAGILALASPAFVASIERDARHADGAFDAVGRASAAPARAGTVTVEDSSRLAAHAVRDVAVEHLSGWLRTRTTRFTVTAEPSSTALELPRGHVELRPRPLSDGVPPSRRMQVWIDLLVDGKLLQSLIVALAVEAHQLGWAAQADLPAGASVGEGSFVRAEVDAAAGSARPWTGSLQGLRLRSAVLKGRFLQAADVSARPAVARGERIALHSRVGGVEIVADAHALQDGQVGDRVNVRVHAARGPVYARVVGSGVAEIAQ